MFINSLPCRVPPLQGFFILLMYENKTIVPNLEYVYLIRFNLFILVLSTRINVLSLDHDLNLICLKKIKNQIFFYET